MKPRAAADTQAVAAEPRRPVRIAVIIPAGPGDDLLDTVASVLRYTDPSRVILVVDDTAGLRKCRLPGPRALARHRGHTGPARGPGRVRGALGQAGRGL